MHLHLLANNDKIVDVDTCDGADSATELIDLWLELGSGAVVSAICLTHREGKLAIVAYFD